MELYGEIVDFEYADLNRNALQLIESSVNI